MPRGAKRKPTTPPEDEKSSKKTKLNLLQCDPREEHFLLPDEIVLQIFQQLERSDILQCSIACRQWYRISQCDEFHWFYIVSFTLVEYASGYHYLRNEKLKTFADLTKEEQEKELQLWQKDSIHNEPPVRIESNTKDDTHWLYDEQDELVAIAKTDMGYSDSWVNFEFNSKKNASLWKYDVTEVTEQYAAAAKGTRNWKARVYINLKRLDEMVIEKNTKAIPNKEVLIDPIDYDWKKHTILQKVIEQGAANIVNTPMVFSGPIQSPQGLINNFTLSERQLEAASWMKSIEDKIGQEFSYTVAMKWKGSRVFFDIDKRNVVHPRDISKYTRIEKISGGILGSDTNRILSYEVIGLMLMSQAKLEPRSDLISSRATLIMCFFNDAKQWQEDIIRATRLNTILIADVEDMKHCTYEDFISKCDVIICTYEVLRSAKYLCLPNTRTKANISPEERNPKVQAALTELITKKNFTEVKTPILEHFFFNRVVFDKAHQAEALHRFQHWSLFLTRKIYGGCKWFISREPFCIEAKNIIPRFFGIKHSSQFLFEYIYRNLMWRNSFTTELNEYLKDEVHLIDMTVIERAVSFYKPNEAFPYCAKTYVEGLKAAAETYLKRMKFMQNQKEFGSSATFQNASEILTEELARLETVDANPKEQTDEEKEFAMVQLQQGTKVAEMLRYLKKLFVEKPNSRVVVFSMEDPSEIILEHQNIERLLNEHGIMTTSVQDDTDDIEVFKKNIEPFKVILMNVTQHSPKTNAIGATHVILLDYMLDFGFSSLALHRAFRQGQASHLVIVRFIFRDTREHRVYLLNTRQPMVDLRTYDPATWKPDQEMKE